MCWQGHGATGPVALTHCCWECKTLQPLWKTLGQLLTKLNILLTYHPAITLFGIYPKELKTYVHPKTCTHMFTAVLFIIAKTWNQSRHPSIGEWVNKAWYIQTMEYFSALKNEFPSHEKTWRKLKCIWLSERSSSEKTMCCMIPTVQHSKQGKTMETVKRSVVARGWGGGKDE